MPPSDELCKRACYLRSENLKEREIANALGTDVTAVSRLLKEGRKRGLYSETHQVRLHLGSKDRRRLTLKYYPERIRQELTCKLSSISSNVPEIHVFPDKDLPKLAATELASIFEDVLNRDLKGSRIAVAWGSNLSDVARELKDVWTYSPRPGTDDGCGSSQNPTIGFLPARGDLLHDKLPVRVGPSRICASISSTVNGKHYEPPSLAQVPVVWRNPFPDGIKVGDQHLSGEQTQEVIFNYFREVAPGVFADAKGGREPLRLTDIDGLLTSVGSAEPTSRFTKAAIEMSGASEREFSNLVLGDMAGVLLGRPGASIEKLKKLQSGWIGLSESDVVKTAHRGRAEGCFGTLVIAKEPSKAEVMIEVVRLGLCNRAMISATLADRLVAMLR